MENTLLKENISNLLSSPVKNTGGYQSIGNYTIEEALARSNDFNIFDILSEPVQI